MVRIRRAVGVCLVLMAAAAHAQGDDQLARARTHFEAGRALMQLKSYSDAIREFLAGYQLAPKPAFLLNLGTCYRGIADGAKDPAAERDALEHARDFYRKFLDDAPKNDPLRGDAKQILDGLEGRLAALPPPAPPPPPQPAPPPPAPHVEAPPATVVAQPPPKQSFVRRHWWIFPVGAVVLAGAAVGIYFAVRPTGVDCSSASLGCVDTRR